MYDVITNFTLYLSFPGEEKLVTFIFINIKARIKKKRPLVMFFSHQVFELKCVLVQRWRLQEMARYSSRNVSNLQ